MGRPLLTVKQVAERLGASPATIYCWKHERRIPCKKLAGLLRFDPDEIDRWVEEQSCPERDSFRQKRSSK